jgi:hypothetical protein
MTTEIAPAEQPPKAAPTKKLGKTAKGKAKKRTSGRKSAQPIAKRAVKKADGAKGKETVREQAVALLRRAGGATLPEMMKKFGWLPHTTQRQNFSESWLKGRRQIRGSTESGYGSIIKRQLVPRLGSLRVAEMRLAGC